MWRAYRRARRCCHPCAANAAASTAAFVRCASHPAARGAVARASLRQRRCVSSPPVALSDRDVVPMPRAPCVGVERRFGSWSTASVVGTRRGRLLPREGGALMTAFESRPGVVGSCREEPGPCARATAWFHTTTTPRRGPHPADPRCEACGARPLAEDERGRRSQDPTAGRRSGLAVGSTRPGASVHGLGAVDARRTSR